MTAVSALGAAASLVASAFALCTGERWLRRRRPHEAAWTISLVMFALGSLAYWWAGAVGWNTANFRAFYLFGAILNVPYLAVGTVFLLGGVVIGRRVQFVVHVLAAFCAGVVLSAPSVGAIPADGLPEGREVFGVGPRVMAAVGSGVAATVLIVGALWSVWRLIRGRRSTVSVAPATPAVLSPRRLVMTNVAIAVGSLVLGAGGTFFTSSEQEVGFGILLVTGIVILFAGFLVTPAAEAPALAPPVGLDDFAAELWTIAHAPPDIDHEAAAA